MFRSEQRSVSLAESTRHTHTYTCAAGSFFTAWSFSMRPFRVSGAATTSLQRPPESSVRNPRYIVRTVDLSGGK